MYTTLPTIDLIVAAVAALAMVFALGFASGYWKANGSRIVPEKPWQRHVTFWKDRPEPPRSADVHLVLSGVMTAAEWEMYLAFRATCPQEMYCDFFGPFV